MIDFFTALSTYSFLQLALLATLLISIPSGVVGTYVVTRRISYLAGGIAHCVLGGIGLARYMQTVHDWSFFTPMRGAIIAALLAAATIGWINIKAKERIDTIISAFWGLGMAGGILAISQTPGYTGDLMQYLFGNILLISPADIHTILWLDGLILGLVFLFHKQFVAICFDEEFARLQGIPVHLFYFLLLALTALTVVLMVSTIGIVMVIILLTLPPAIANRFSHRITPIMILSAGLCAVLSFFGLFISYNQDLPAGACIITLTCGCYLLSLLRKR